MVIEYQPQLLDEYAGNPLIEALPPIMDSVTVTRGISNLPRYANTDRQLPAEIRLHMLERLRYIVLPQPRHIYIAKSLLRLVRSGYVARNPLEPKTRQHLHFIAMQGRDGIPEPANFTPTSSAMGLTGLSGIGKTTLVESTLRLLPQTLVHDQYHGKPLSQIQVVWLKIDCPHDGSFKGLCFAFFRALDQALGVDKYYKKYARGRKSVENLLQTMALLAYEYHVGILIIDELQNLLNAGNLGADKMLAFFVNLINEVGIPIALVGTYAAIELFSRSLRMARRVTHTGVHTLTPPEENSDDWKLLTETVWHYQWTRDPAPLTDRLSRQVRDLSQGITDVLVKLYLLAQEEAIESGSETVTFELLCTVLNERLAILKPALNALKSGKPDALTRFDDLWPNHEKMQAIWNRSAHGATAMLQQLEDEDLISTPLPDASPPSQEHGYKSQGAADAAEASSVAVADESQINSNSAEPPLDPGDLRLAARASNPYDALSHAGHIVPEKLLQYLRGE